MAKDIEINDFYQFKFYNRPMLSPDGKYMIYERTEIEDNYYKTELWLTDLEGITKERLPNEGRGMIDATWAPDSKFIAYATLNASGTTLVIYSLPGREIKEKIELNESIEHLQFSPDGKRLFALCKIQKDGQTPHKKAYESQYYKLDGVGFHTGFTNQLIAIDLKEKSIERLTENSLNVADYTISPNGKKLAFIVTDLEHKNPLNNGVLYKLDLTEGNTAILFDDCSASRPNFSPDSEWVAFIAGDVHERLYICSFEEGETLCLSEDYPDALTDLIYTDVRYERSPWKPLWSRDQKILYALSGHQGTNEIVAFPLSTDQLPKTVIGGPRAIYDFSYDGKETFVIAYTSPTSPGKISKVSLTPEEYIMHPKRKPTDPLSEVNENFPKAEVELVNENKSYTESVNQASFESFSITAEDEWVIHGFILKPAYFEVGKKYPVLLDIHGGPHSTHGYAYFHQMQLFCQEGYVVVYFNPRGSSGYGEDFTRAVIDDYGGKDKKDILKGLNEVLKRYDFLDETKVAVNGLSYGGFMTNWLLTQTDRFVAGISEGGISNWVSMYGTGDVDPGMTDEDLPSKNNFSSLWEISPLAYVEKVTTPLLILHAEEDHRVPIEQGEQFYTHLKRLGKVARFVKIPDSSHLMLQNAEPKKRIARLEEMLHWLRRFVK